MNFIVQHIKIRILRVVVELKTEEETGGWENYILRSSCIVFVIVVSVNKSKEETSVEHVTRVLHEKCLQNYSWKTLMEETTCET